MDNRYYKYNCPPLMNDGRFVSSYIRSKTFDQYIRNINDLSNSSDYRHFLQKNGDKILNNLKAYHRENSVCKIEGKCLPMSGPTSDDMNKYLIHNNKEPNSWTDELLNQNININNINNYQNNSKPVNYTGEDFNAYKAQNLAHNIYQQMLYDQEQNNLNNYAKTPIAEDTCTFCAK